ncbi:MAG: hypothetical protein NTV49_01080 [Kiritimatiellaeota bacterium]|nr:hypothetical protein [Kiritimatiellota bacterium]
MTEQAKPERLHFGLLLLISFALFNIGPIIDQTIRWTDHLHGFINGVFHILMFGIAWYIYILPWSLVIFALYRWRKWKRFRTHWVLAPVLLAVATTLWSLIVDPPTPTNRFKRFAHAELPSNARNLHFYFSGGGIADYSDTYYFETIPEEVDRLVARMNLEKDEFYGKEDVSYTPITALPGCPNFTAWNGAQQYRHDNKGWFYYLITDASKTQVYILIGCI